MQYITAFGEAVADEARNQIRVTLQARQAALSTAVARLLVQNNESQEQADQQIRHRVALRFVCLVGHVG